MKTVFIIAASLLGSFVGLCAEGVTATTNLPVILLDAKEAIPSDRKVPCSVQMILPTGSAGSTSALSGVVRVRGGVSQGYAKKSYGLTLKNSAQWLGMRQSEHWILNAAFVDRSLMRHKLSYDLFRSLSVPGANRYAVASRFVEVRLNQEYNGAYLLMERVDRALLGLRKFDSNAPSHACIYKAVDHAANFSQPGHAGFEQQEPDDSAKTYWGPLDEFNKFVSSATDAEFLDAQNGIASRLDLTNAIDFQLIVLLTCNLDGITKNFIIARNAVITNAPAPRFFFVPWDYDGTFGRNWDASRVGPDVWLENHLFARLHKDAAFRTTFAARWKQLRQRQFAIATIHGLMDENVRTLGGSAERNSARWNMLEGFPDKVSLAEDVAQMKEWLSARLKWLDAEIGRRARD